MRTADAGGRRTCRAKGFKAGQMRGPRSSVTSAQRSVALSAQAERGFGGEAPQAIVAELGRLCQLTNDEFSLGAASIMLPLSRRGVEQALIVGAIQQPAQLLSAKLRTTCRSAQARSTPARSRGVLGGGYRSCFGRSCSFEHAQRHDHGMACSVSPPLLTQHPLPLLPGQRAECETALRAVRHATRGRRGPRTAGRLPWRAMASLVTSPTRQPANRVISVCPSER